MPDTLIAPAFKWCPDYTTTYGPEVVDLAASVGLALDGNQAMCLDDMFSLRPGAGSWNVVEDATVCDRQNLKTVLLEAGAFAKATLFKDERVVWTAHEYPTSVEAFRDMKPWFTDFDHISRLVKQVYEGKGDESIEFMDGRWLLFRARTKHGGRGISGDTVILDEAQKLTAANMGALIPTISARQRSQILYGGTAGDITAHVFRRIRDRGRKGGDPRLAYREWCAPVTPCERDACTHIDETGCALDRMDLILLANPALAIPGRLREEVILTERQTLPASEFMRERMGWWEEPLEGGGAIDLGLWENLTDLTAERGNPLVFGIATAPDRSWSAVAVAWQRPDGNSQCLLLDYRPGATWVDQRVTELRASGGKALCDTASRGLVQGAEEPSTAHQAQAHNRLADAVEAGTIRHGGEAALTTSVSAARWRPQGDTRVLDRKGNADISPLIAVSLALYGLTSKPAGGWMVGLP